MSEIDFKNLCIYAKHFSNLDNEKINTLHQIHPAIQADIPQVTDSFYKKLLDIPKARPFLEGRLESLKRTHQEWVEELFTSDFGEAYTQKLYVVGDIHVKVRLPVEFMAGAMVIIQGELLQHFARIYGDDIDMLVQANTAINSATGFSLLVMQESYQSSTLASELEKFLHITGMSRTLFDNLAKAYK